MIRSRYCSRYPELEQRLEPIIFPEPRHLDRESYFVDIAEGDFGNIRISCWLQPEGLTPGRRWGKVGKSHAAILPFGTMAQVLKRQIRLKTFEIELFLSKLGPQGLTPELFPIKCPGPECQRHPGISLIRHPAPSEVTQRSIGSASSNARNSEPWKFRSEFIWDCDRHSRAAKWTWEAHNNDPVPLHGALALQHEGNDFFITCRTRGELYIVLRRGARLRLDFNNESRRPEWWKLSPEPPHDDLSASVSRLEVETQRLNQNRIILAPETASQERPRAQGGSYEHVNIGGNARVIVGSGTFGQTERDSLPSPRTQQPVLGHALSEIPQTSGQYEETEEVRNQGDREGRKLD